MVRAAIVGGGFAGLAAARKLAHVRGLEVTLVDCRPAQQFLPLFPDVIGRGLRPETVSYPLVHAAERWGCQVITAAAHDIDLEARHVHCAGGTLPFDYLILAAGTTTAFPEKRSIQQHALPLDTVDDALRIKRTVCHHAVETVFVCGAGYTGLEVATYLQRLFREHSEERQIILADVAPTPLPQLPEIFQNYALRQLDKLDIDFMPETTVADADENTVTLIDGTRFEDAVLIWTAGIECPKVIRQLQVDKTKQQRIVVQPDLSFAEGCFAAGDAAGFNHTGHLLRPSAQFAISQGCHAARNVRRHMAGRETKPYGPYDPGYVVPMGHGKGCGMVFGKPVTGRLPYMLHYSIAGMRSYGIANRAALLRDLRSPDS